MKDKIFHSLACAFITCFTFTFSLAMLKICSAIRRHDEDLCLCAARCHNHDHDDDGMLDLEQRHDDHDDVEIASPRLAEEESDHRQQLFPVKVCIVAFISGVVAMGAGIAKEIFDAYELLWNGDTFSWGDILADFIGVVIGEIVIVTAVLLRSNTKLSWKILQWRVKDRSNRKIQSHNP